MLMTLIAIILVQAPGGARPKPVYVAPPLPPPGLATPPTPHATWWSSSPWPSMLNHSWSCSSNPNSDPEFSRSRDNTAPESGSSSPLLRAGAGGQYSAVSICICISYIYIYLLHLCIQVSISFISYSYPWTVQRSQGGWRCQDVFDCKVTLSSSSASWLLSDHFDQNYHQYHR